MQSRRSIFWPDEMRPRFGSTIDEDETPICAAPCFLIQIFPWRAARRMTWSADVCVSACRHEQSAASSYPPPSSTTCKFNLVSLFVLLSIFDETLLRSSRFALLIKEVWKLFCCLLIGLLSSSHEPTFFAALCCLPSLPPFSDSPLRVQAQFRNNLVFAGAAAEISLFALMCRVPHILVEIYVVFHAHTHTYTTNIAPILLARAEYVFVYLSSLSRIHSFNVEQFYCFILLFRLAPSFASSFIER